MRSGKQYYICHTDSGYLNLLLEEYYFLSCAFFHLDGLFAMLLRKHLSHKHALGTVVVLLYFIHKTGARIQQIQQ